MLIEQTVRFLETTHRPQLQAVRSEVRPLRLEPRDVSALTDLRTIYAAIGTPHHWRTRVLWSDAQWAAWLNREGLRSHLAMTEGNTIGMVELEIQADGDVEIVVLGLVPAFVGQGWGGELLRQALAVAWNVNWRSVSDAAATRRVWLHTSSLDHPNALANYERHGLRVYRTEQRQKEISDAP
ncbi:MAG TPA: GNAT family N-acetyltransferase [Myxococcaceae bacterium]|nr:GNAT family N-acetyltransferase [Myxococcaceae bacterium]